ncbi:MAG: glycosyltransferase [Anaerolineaceae bacterium]|nr:glycosyltransferase [Anaerolineaceae bacterium]
MDFSTRIQFFKEFFYTYPIIRNHHIYAYPPAESELDTLHECGPGNHARTRGKISLISTILNEEDNVDEWFASLDQQTRKPNELVITECGSSDNTLRLLRMQQSEHPEIHFHIIEAPRANIAHGRNLAIQHASHEIIAMTDFGCKMAPDWLEKLCEPLESNPAFSLSAGIWKIAESPVPYFNQYLGYEKPIDLQSFLPAASSIAVRRSLWEQTEGFPEWLTDAGEDTLFDYQLATIPTNWAFVSGAVIYWHSPATRLEHLKKVQRYAFGDGESGVHANSYRRVIYSLAGFSGLLLITLGLAISLFWHRSLINGIPLLLSSASLLIFWHKQGIGFPPAPANLYEYVRNRIFKLQLFYHQARGFIRGVQNRIKKQAAND